MIPHARVFPRVLPTVLLLLAGGVGGCSSTSPREGGSVRSGALPPEAAGPAGSPVICLHANAGGQEALFEVLGLPLAQLDPLSERELPASDWSSVFAVYIETPRADGARAPDVPPIIGRYDVKDGALRFEPRFGLTPGLAYRAVFSQARFDRLAPRAVRGTSNEAVEARFTLPAPPRVATTTVLEVYPTARTLPENQLKFYLHFSAPMRQGEAYSHIHLVHSSGREVDLPFLELDEELWDWDGTRLTLFIDPGRIKRQVAPHEELGPALTAGETYELRIDSSWRDAKKNPLKRSFTKTFRVGPPDYDPPDPQTWSIRPPAAGTLEPLTVRFPEPLDHALLERVVWVADVEGNQLTGDVAVTSGEQQWSFTPNSPWRVGEHRLVALSTLEDLAGNGIDRPFEVDVFQKVKKHVDVKRVEVPFSVE